MQNTGTILHEGDERALHGIGIRGS
jgi:hypothetical protein